MIRAAALLITLSRRRSRITLPSALPPAVLGDYADYLFTPVVEVLSGFCVAPDFGMTVSFMFVGGMLG